MLGEKCSYRPECLNTEVGKAFAFGSMPGTVLSQFFIIGGEFGYEGLEKHQENLRKFIDLFKKIRHRTFVLCLPGSLFILFSPLSIFIAIIYET